VKQEIEGSVPNRLQLALLNEVFRLIAEDDQGRPGVTGG
jgi:hypothetical protein